MSKLDDISLEDLDELLNGEDEKVKIDLTNMIRKLYARRRLFIISFFLTLLVVAPLTFTMPKVYKVEVKLAPELSSAASSTTGLSSIMKSMGLTKYSNTGTDDAILPNLYPDLINSKTFLVSLFDIPVQSKKGDIKTTYYDYLLNYQKTSALSKALGAVFSLLPSGGDDADDVNDDVKATGNAKKLVNAGKLSKQQTGIAMTIAHNVVCDVDKKTGIISIGVSDQDPVICATIADSTCNRLQEFITEYRTRKSRIEMENAQKQYDQAKHDYLVAKEKAESFNDSNWDLVDEDMLVEKQALQNNMQMCFSNMSTFNQQLLVARSKYESLRPVYTILDGASVPLKSSGPHRIRLVIVFIFLVLGAEAVWVLFFADFKKKMKEAFNEPVEENAKELKES